MKGGGAERITALLANHMFQSGIDVKIMVTNQNAQDVYRRDLNDKVEILSLNDMVKKSVFLTKAYYCISGIISRISCKLSEKFKKEFTAKKAYKSFMWQNYDKVAAFHEYLKKNPDTTVISFLQPTIPIVMLAAHGLPNRIIFSERGNSERLMKSRYGYEFVQKYYDGADVAVFQSEGAMEPYPENIRKKGTIIFNPLAASLPEPYIGKRKKVIVNFCRISYQKNLPLLIEAFEKLHKVHSEYKLLIIGDAYTQDEKQLQLRLEKSVNEKGISEFVSFMPFMGNIHEYIKEFSMFVSSSDYEGMSNSMLEAMAIGLPSVCTDCPSGGARAIIKNRENGLLVPVNDADALYEAMKEVIENLELANKMSSNGAKLREELKLENIVQQWINLL